MWLWDIMGHSYTHKATKGLYYDICVEGLPRNQVTNKIATRAIKKSGIRENISKLEHHRLNRELGKKDAFNFKTVRNSKTTQLTIIVPFTKLDLISKSKNGNNFLMNNHIEELHSCLKSRSCVIIA